MSSAAVAELQHLERAPDASPFLKWVGGKGQLLSQIEPLLPAQFGRHIEPFVGGGALFFHLSNLGRTSNGAVLSDLNHELMNCYRIIQDAANLSEIIRLLRRHARRVTDGEYFYQVRAWDRSSGFLRRHGPVVRAARTIFLNHACYNGLYRLNSSGQFNVPFGKWIRPPSLFDEENLWACHTALRDAELYERGFDSCLEWARPGDFVYFDPPYHPLSSTSSFTTYTGAEFREDHQRRLAGIYRTLDERGCFVMLSNSDTPLIHGLYADFRVTTVMAARAVSCKANGRGKITELVVTNY